MRIGKLSERGRVFRGFAQENSSVERGTTGDNGRLGNGMRVLAASTIVRLRSYGQGSRFDPIPTTVVCSLRST